MSSRLRRVSIIATVVLTLALLAPAIADAGVYRAAICNPGLGAWHPDARFVRTSDHYASDAGCAIGQAGLLVRHEGKRTREGRWGAWAIRAPRGTVISHLGVSSAGRRSGGQVPQLLMAPLGGSAQPFAMPHPGLDWYRSAAPARAFPPGWSARVRGVAGVAADPGSESSDSPFSCRIASPPRSRFEVRPSPGEAGAASRRFSRSPPTSVAA